MKITQIVTMIALALGLSQLAYAEHEGADGKVCEHKHGMQAADANKDGAVSRDEFMAAHQKMADGMFTKMDANNDGKIEQAERQAMKDKMGKDCKMKHHKKHEMHGETAPK
ncbi:MAG: EF-hand domain-containing protein [Methylotenera sp.]|nr:EF-hand domain-containing protein [Methylotenera sp.]